MLPADSAGNVIGTEVEATQDINVRAATDQAIVGATPASLYADTGDHRSHVVVQVRDAAPAIIDEARDHHCAVIMLGQGPNTDHRVHNDVGKVIPYVLTHAPCRVWVMQDQQAA